MLSKTSIVIMGTLTKGEKNAYDILKMIDRMNMKYWLPIGATTLYETCIRLEKKGLITRKLAIKNNRPVKIIEITKDGIDRAEYAADKIRPHYIEIKEKINNSDISHVGGLLKDLREVLADSLQIHI